MDVLKQHKLESRDEELANAFLRGVKLIGWMAEYVGKMAPGNYGNAYSELNDFWLFDARVNRQVKQLTSPQVEMLKAAVRHGHAFGNVGVRSGAGGAKLRMAGRLGELGLLTPRAPFEITVLGRIVLSRKVGRT